MKALDKIYVPIIDMGVEEGGEQLAAIWWKRDNSEKAPDFNGVVEYVRKDAIKEFAQKKNKRLDGTGGDYTLGYIHAMIDVIDKINSL